MTRSRRPLATLVVLGFSTISVPLLAGTAGPPAFVETTSDAGVTSPTGVLFPGPAWGDYDRDGCPDLFLPAPEGNELYESNCDGTFALSAYNAVLEMPDGGSRGSAFADYNNDGWPDLYVASREANYLFRNDAGTGFTEVSASAGVDDSRPSYGIGWADYDNDGDLDLFAGNYHFEDGDAGRDTIYRNDGDGTFTDVSHLFEPVSQLQGPNLAVRWVDYDNDDDLDLYVINDRDYKNVMWRNDGAGCAEWCWTDVSAATGTDIPVQGMGIDAGDYDQDGDLDLWFSSIGEAVLLRSEIAQGQEMFTDVSIEAGVTREEPSWSSLFWDYDNDGWEDLLLAISHTTVGSRVFKNNRDGTFTDVSDGSGLDTAARNMGIALSDYDGDGKVEPVFGRMADGYFLFRNETATDHNWLVVTVEGTGRINRDAIGTKLYLTTTDGRTQYKDVKSGNGFCSGGDIAVHFGLGDAEVDSLTLVWPDGSVDVHEDVPHNQVRHFVFGSLFADGFESGDSSRWSTTVP